MVNQKGKNESSRLPPTKESQKEKSGTEKAQFIATKENKTERTDEKKSRDSSRKVSDYYWRSEPLALKFDCLEY